MNNQEKPSSKEAEKEEVKDSAAAADCYRCLVVDSGPIIRMKGMSTLWQSAHSFYTVPAVLQEIRDAKARQHLESLPFTLQCREASPEGIQAVVEFARQTGDYNSLSSVDLQVLGLLYDLEREGCCGDMSHIRTTPKRTVGLGKIEALGRKKDTGASQVEGEETKQESAAELDPSSPVSNESVQQQMVSVEETKDSVDRSSTAESAASDSSKPKSWAALLSPPAPKATVVSEAPRRVTKVTFANSDSAEKQDDLNGQFSDAESDSNDEEEVEAVGSGSDDECDVYILDPNEVVQPNSSDEAAKFTSVIQEQLSEFPSLAEAALVPYAGSDDEKEETHSEDGKSPSNGTINNVDTQQEGISKETKEEEEERKRQALRPVSKSGKLYNSFRKYGDLMKPKPPNKQQTSPANVASEDPRETQGNPASATKTEEESRGRTNQSRIIGGMSFAGQGDDVEDDGEGWITNTKDIRTMKAVGALDPSRSPDNLVGNQRTLSKQPQGPAKNQRAACTTTDFAMQNVILQMNLELLSVDGMKVRKLKNWVTRCGACFAVYTNSDNPGPFGKRLFCERCGSDMMQRIAASVDGKTGRLRLHLSKKYKHNLRGTKFSLPKPGTGNRFQGDLLLREDQLMMGAWNQKVKMRSGGKARNASQSMFGADIAANVGCHSNARSMDDIRVGFGRRNPNAVKGRERRGKKKKSSDKACGLRRY